MSLINDALKRATSLRKKEPAHDGVIPMEPVESRQQKRSNVRSVTLLAALLLAFGYAGWSWFGGGSPTPAAAAGAPSTNKAAAKTGSANNAASLAAKRADNTNPTEKNGSTNNNPLARASVIAEKIRSSNEIGAQEAERIDAAPDRVATQVAEAQKVSISKAAPAASSDQDKNIDSSQFLANPADTTAQVSKVAGSAFNQADFPAVQLQAIYYRSKNPAAVVNGKMFREGEEVNGVTIAQIARDEIRLEYHGQAKSIKLK
ncbi:MAG: hypothetical protein ACO1QB_03980 [Verrucomicrobiales bacterium]